MSAQTKVYYVRLPVDKVGAAMSQGKSIRDVVEGCLDQYIASLEQEDPEPGKVCSFCARFIPDKDRRIVKGKYKFDSFGCFEKWLHAAIKTQVAFKIGNDAELLTRFELDWRDIWNVGELGWGRNVVVMLPTGAQLTVVNIPEVALNNKPGHLPHHCMDCGGKFGSADLYPYGDSTGGTGKVFLYGRNPEGGKGSYHLGCTLPTDANGLRLAVAQAEKKWKHINSEILSGLPVNISLDNIEVK